MQPVALLVCFSMAVTLCAGHFQSFGTITTTNVSCTPRSLRTCGEHTLLSTNSTPNQNYGPNVCNVVRTYSVRTYSYVETMYCFGTRCRTYCTQTNNCTGAMRNLTKRKTECCDGFAINPDDEESAKASFYRHTSRRSSVLRESGCTTTLADSVAVCLLDLNLESFVVEVINDAGEVIPLLGQSDSNDRFTIFAMNSSSTDSVNALGHIANGTVDKKYLGSGSVFRSLREDVLLHVVRGLDKQYYVNGAEIMEFNACQARNGVVHVVNSPIPQSTQTIAGILKDDPRFSMFLQLLDGANITMFLDIANGKSRTVLAPTDEAFNKLPADAVECLLRPENRRRLNELVLIHISSPAEYSATLSQRSRLYTFNTRYYLFVRTDEDDNILVTNDRIPLEETDIPANNGVIHAIPSVIVPPEVEFDKLCGEDRGDSEIIAVIGD